LELLGDSLENQGLSLAISANSYSHKVIPRHEGRFRKALKSSKTLMSEGYHPDIFDIPLCTDKDSARYRSIIGCCI
jgi:hypothetical protein